MPKQSAVGDGITLDEALVEPLKILQSNWWVDVKAIAVTGPLLPLRMCMRACCWMALIPSFIFFFIYLSSDDFES